MKMMTAARVHEYGKPLVIEEIERPVPRPTDVVVQVKACNLVPNLDNVLNRFAEWFPWVPLPPLPAVFGLDVAGVVDQVGELVTDIKAGDRVYVSPLRSCGCCHNCRIGEPQHCMNGAFQGYFGFVPGAAKLFKAYPNGGMAEYLAAPASSLIKLADSTTFEQASRFGYIGTAYGALKKAHTGTGKTVIVTGATGTLGVPAVMLALAMGASRVFAIARNCSLLERLRALDPARVHTLSYGDEPVADWVMRHNDGRGADIYIDALSTGASAQVAMDTLKALRRGGVAVGIGGLAEPLSIDPAWFMTSGLSWIGSLWFSTGEGEELAAMAGAGTLDLRQLDEVRFPLSQANEALASVAARSSGGFTNVVIVP